MAGRTNPYEVPKEPWTDLPPLSLPGVVDRDTGLVAGSTYEKGDKKIPFKSQEIILFPKMARTVC